MACNGLQNSPAGAWIALQKQCACSGTPRTLNHLNLFLSKPHQVWRACNIFPTFIIEKHPKFSCAHFNLTFIIERHAQIAVDFNRTRLRVQSGNSLKRFL